MYQLVAFDAGSEPGSKIVDGVFLKEYVALLIKSGDGE